MAYSKTSNTPRAKSVKYLNKNFNDFKTQLTDFAQSYFPDTYNDFSDSSPGMMFIEMAAYVGDVLSYYQDTQLQENFLLLAQEKENLYNLAYSLGYKPKVTNTSTVILDVFQLVPSDASNDHQPDMSYALNIKEGSSFMSTGPKFITEKDVDFKTDSDLSPLEITVYSINNLNNKPEYYLLNKKVKAHSGEIKKETFEIGSYTKFLTLTINETDIIEIESIVDSNGDKWTEVPYLAQDTVFDAVENIASKDPQLHGYNESTPYLLSLKKVPKRFVTRVKSNDTLEIQFGAGENSVVDEEIIPNPDNIGLGIKDGRSKLEFAYDPSNFLYTGTYGLVPTNTVLTVNYKVNSFGVAANVVAGSINKPDILNIKSSPNLDQSLSQYIRDSITVTNLTAATGGGSGDTVNDVRQNAMANFSAQNRTVTKDDYLIRTLSMPSKFGRVAKAYITQDDQISPLTSSPGRIPNPMALNLYILGYNNQGNLTTLNLATKTNLQTYLEQHRMLTDAVNIKDAFFINIEIEFEIIAFKNFNNQAVLKQCLEELKIYFGKDKWQINQPIIISEIYNAIGAIDGVQSVPNVKINNVVGQDLGYSPYKYDLDDATIKGIIYPSLDPSIFEVRFPNQDIKGKITQY
jgi:AraC-like DNA-binding protein